MKENYIPIRTDDSLWKKRFQRISTLLLACIMLFSLFSMEGTTVFADSVSSVVSGKYTVAKVKTPTLRSVAAKSATSVTIKWKKVSGAKGYAIYQQKNGKYVRVGTVKGGSKTTYTKTKLKAATKYTFKVKAYQAISGKNKYSAYSNAKSTYTLPATPKVTAKATSTSTIKVSWKKVSKAKGYVIYRKSGSSYKKVATVKSGSKTSYTVKKLSSDKKYTFVVRSYFKPNGKTVYSARSSAKSATTWHEHDFVDHICMDCGAIENAYEYLRAWLLENGEVDGSYVGLTEYNHAYDISYSLWYSAEGDYVYLGNGYDNTDGDYRFTQIRLDNYEYFSSVGTPVYNDFVKGTLDAQNFTSRTPLINSDYNSTYYTTTSVTTTTRENICAMLTWFDNFLYENDLGITIADLGFESF